MSRRKKTTEPVEEVIEEIMPAPETEPEKNPEVLCYVGPSVPGLLQHGITYKGALPDWLVQIKSECPAIGALLIPVDELPGINYKSGFVPALSAKVLAWASKRR